MTPENPTKEFIDSNDVKNTDIYKAIEAMISLEITNLNEYIQKRKDSKTKTSKNIYDKRIDKIRQKILKYLFQLDSLTKGEVQKVLEEIQEEESECEKDKAC